MIHGKSDLAARLFEEALEFWESVSTELAENKNRKPGAVIAVPLELVDGLTEIGIDLNLTEVYTCIPSDKDGTYGRYDGIVEGPDNEYAAFVALTKQLLEKIELALKKLWTRSVGTHSSQPRFQLPDRHANSDLKRFVADQKERLHKYLRPESKKRTKGNRPPSYVIIIEGDRYTARFLGGNKQATVHLNGQSRQLMNLIIEEFTRTYVRIPNFPLDLKKKSTVKKMLDERPVYIKYIDVEMMIGARRDNKNEENDDFELQSVDEILRAKSQAHVRKIIERFNNTWKQQTKTENEAVLVSDCYGQWRLQTMLFFPPEQHN